MENDRLRRFVESAVRKTLLQHANRALRGQPIDNIAESINDSLNESCFAPALAISRDKTGKVVLVLDPEVLLNKTAFELRQSGFIVPDGIPDCAVITRDPQNALMFTWKRLVAEL